MDGNLLYNVFTVLEVIAVEFISIWFLSQKKHSFIVSLGTYAAVTVPLITLMCLVISHLPGYGNGNGGFMTLGVFYFIPAMLNYGGDWRNRIIIAFYSFSFGLGGFAVSIRIGYLFGSENLSRNVFIIQTLFYAAAFPIYLMFSRRKVIVYIRKSDFRQKGLLIRYTITSFILIVFYNYVMVADGSMLVKLLVYLLLIYFIILTYRLMVSYLKVDDDNQELSELARTDRLTGLGNRLALRNALETLVKEGKPFYLLFMDLDHFKAINDRYGHAAGDDYLKRFAEHLRIVAGMESMCFRLAGDEFICLTQDAELFEDLQTMEPLKPSPPQTWEFLGVSIGIAKYPEDSQSAAELLEFADRHMYARKTQKTQ